MKYKVTYQKILCFEREIEAPSHAEAVRMVKENDFDLRANDGVRLVHVDFDFDEAEPT